MFSKEEADRILGLGDQFMEDWEATRDSGDDALAEVKERRATWDKYRPLFVAAPKMKLALEEIRKGSEVAGRWLNEKGEECPDTEEGAEFHPYNEDEQEEWPPLFCFAAKPLNPQEPNQCPFA